MAKDIRTLSSKESKLILQLEWDKKRVITLRDIKDILNCSKGYARKIAHILKTKQWLETIEPGHYILISADRGIEPVVPEMNPYIIVKILNEPYYFAYGIACLYHGLITQIPSIIHIVLRRKKQPIRLKNIEFNFIKIAGYKFFGWREVDLYGERINITNLEKTVIDSIDKPNLIGGIEETTRVLHRASKKINWNKLKSYVSKMNSSTLSRRLGYLLNILKVEFPNEFEDFLLSKVKKDKAYLDSPLRWGKSGKKDKKWNLIINVSYKELTGEI